MLFKKLRPAHEYKPEELPGVRLFLTEFTAGEVSAYASGLTNPLGIIATHVERVEGLNDPDGKPIRDGSELADMLAHTRGTVEAIKFVSDLTAQVYRISRLDEEESKNLQPPADCTTPKTL